MSIVRVGLAETKKFAEGYDAIFGKKAPEEAQAEAAPVEADRKSAGKKPAEKKATARKTAKKK